MPARRAVVAGSVQGVGYRAYAQRKARSLGIVGEVWNRADGAVELVFGHDDEAVLERFQKELEGGPGWVRSVHASSLSEELSQTDFEVGMTRF